VKQLSEEFGSNWILDKRRRSCLQFMLIVICTKINGRKKKTTLHHINTADAAVSSDLIYEHMSNRTAVEVELQIMIFEQQKYFHALSFIL
jgi:hypothetical protein